MKNRNLGWGLFFIAAAITIIMTGMGALGSVSWLRVIAALFMIPMVISGIRRREFAGVFIPLALIAILFSVQLNISSLVPWPILITAVLLSIGFSFLFPKNKKQHVIIENMPGETVGGETVYISANFGESIKYVDSNDVKSIRIDAMCSSVKVYLDKVQFVPGDTLVVNVNSRFSSVDLYIPRDWMVENVMENVMGAIEEKGNVQADKSNIKLMIMGKQVGAATTIRYI